MNTQQEAGRLLAPMKTVILITTGEDGRPDARAMAVVLAEGLKTVWMATGKCSDKYRQLKRNPEALLYATDQEDTEKYLELRLWGRVELRDDAEFRARAWRDEYLQYFPGGKDDPNLAVLKFTATSGVLQTQMGKEKLAL